MVQTVTDLPTPPTRTDPTNFDTRADALMTALPQFVTEINVLGGDVETAHEACLLADLSAAGYAAQASSSANFTEYSAVATYDYPDTVSTTTGDTYRCIGTSVTGVNPVTDGGTNWKLLTFPGSGLWITKTGAYSIAPFERVFVNLTGGSFTITLPSPVWGISRVWISDIGETINSTDVLTIARGGNPIMGINEDMTVEIPGAAFSLLAVSAAYGWKLVPFA